MHSRDDTSRRSARTSTVAATIDRRRMLTMTAAILLVTLALLALTMFGPGRPLADVQADMAAMDGAVPAPAAMDAGLAPQTIEHDEISLEVVTVTSGP